MLKALQPSGGRSFVQLWMDSLDDPKSTYIILELRYMHSIYIYIYIHIHTCNTPVCVLLYNYIYMYMYMYNLHLNVTESSSVHGQGGGPIAPIGTEEISRNSYVRSG